MPPSAIHRPRPRFPAVHSPPPGAAGRRPGRAGGARTAGALQNRKDHGLVRVENQTRFAEQVGMSQSSVSRALKQLAEHGFIYPDGRDWRLRADFVFNGGGAAQGQAVRNIPADAPDPYASGGGLTLIDGGAGERPEDQV
ncbi:helix-turn-helix domain-containing protein [Streptomyces filamentosus]|uniref:helix-turn-helix domain-containing protein n=1 Tax=Streptomyces filamentosus TaxID=67294 RepID=UPI0036EEEB7E